MKTTILEYLNEQQNTETNFNDNFKKWFGNSIMEQQMQDQIALACVSGSFIDKRYIKCPHTSKSCKWKMSNNHSKSYEYLNGACYLSGSFKLECPD